jgi:hypothetical protein
MLLLEKSVAAQEVVRAISSRALHVPEAHTCCWHAAMQSALLDVEADSYWCMCKLLEGIQDHYTYAQPGIQRTIFRFKELIRCAALLL